MLRLHLGPMLPWVDSKNRIRSPVEEFAVLSADSRSQIAQETSRFVTWKIGVLSDDWDHPEHAKPIDVGADAGALLATCYALGDAADSHVNELLPLLRSFLVLLRKDAVYERWFCADSFWQSSSSGQQRLESFGDAALTRLSALREAKVEQVEGTKYFTIRLSPTLAANALSSWWPSPAFGQLEGILSREGLSDAQDRALATSGKLRLEVLSSVSHIFSVSRSFDNLGIAVVSTTDVWREVQDRLTALAWADGKPVDLLEYPSE